MFDKNEFSSLIGDRTFKLNKSLDDVWDNNLVPDNCKYFVKQGLEKSIYSIVFEIKKSVKQDPSYLSSIAIICLLDRKMSNNYPQSLAAVLTYLKGF